MLPLIITGLAITGVILFAGGKKDDDEPGPPDDPQPKGRTKKTPPVDPTETPPVVQSNNEAIVPPDTVIHLRTSNKILDPEGAGVFLLREDAGGDYRDAKDSQMTGEGWSVANPDREYVVRAIAPGNYKIQLMEEPSFQSVFLGAWYVTVAESDTIVGARGYVAPAWRKGGRLAKRKRRRKRVSFHHPAVMQVIAVGPEKAEPLWAWQCGLCVDGSPMMCVDWDDGTTTGGC